MLWRSGVLRKTPVPHLDAPSRDTQIFIEVAEDAYRKSAATVQAELKRLEGELHRADARGDRHKALSILSRMLELQRKFMDRWITPGRPGSNPGSV
jgi:hypothetical protein